MDENAAVAAVASNRSGPVSVAAFHRRLNETTTATGNRLSAGRELREQLGGRRIFSPMGTSEADGRGASNQWPRRSAGPHGSRQNNDVACYRAAGQ
jgi:hypothetical protein